MAAFRVSLLLGEDSAARVQGRRRMPCKGRKGIRPDPKITLGFQGLD
jgi:hypothetical protein